MLHHAIIENMLETHMYFVSDNPTKILSNVNTLYTYLLENERVTLFSVFSLSVLRGKQR